MYAARMRFLKILLLVAAAACGSSRSTYARYPGAPVAFDRTTAKPEALELAEKILAAHGGAAAWEKAKQIRWHQSIEHEGKVLVSGGHAWDRWNGRHWAELDRDDGNNTGVMYEIYGDYASGYILSKSGSKQPVPPAEIRQAIVLARQAWQRDTTVLLAPFLLLDPGSRLELVGEIKDDATGTIYTELKLTFDPKDTMRTGVVVHLYADKTTGLVNRLDLEIGADRYAYTLGAFQNVGGLKLATERKNANSGEVVKLKDIKVGDPDDELYITPLFGPA